MELVKSRWMSMPIAQLQARSRTNQEQVESKLLTCIALHHGRHWEWRCQLIRSMHVSSSQRKSKHSHCNSLRLKVNPSVLATVSQQKSIQVCVGLWISVLVFSSQRIVHALALPCMMNFAYGASSRCNSKYVNVTPSMSVQVHSNQRKVTGSNSTQASAVPCKIM